MDPKDPKSPTAPQARAPAPNGREARLAQALRANLRRRKQAGDPPSSADA